ncbi:NEFA-interacting nuclear protein NIP30 [Striga asiatica]|uniref:NEFA-interacting nuclear protein NIP30 n=1 Tax=Striga asiatica TaxID=4170 RepID=A0A5A7QLU6_STRAF|nr:NEFA-interacting nuclear protein NIP30 [Striga asiatica]
MADNEAQPPVRLMNFVSEDQLEEARRTRGARVEDGTAQRDKSLYDVRIFPILKENKDKKDAEFNERFKHRPPKALDEDETEFLDRLEMSRREYERQVADEEEQQLRSFQAAVASQSNIVHELKEAPSVPKTQDKNSVVRRKNTASRPLGLVIKVKPQAKKAKVEFSSRHEAPGESVKQVSQEMSNVHTSRPVAITGLVSYSDESEDDV